jgi:hypothetical protein
MFISVLGFGVWGVWLGAGTSVILGWILSMFIAGRIARIEIGGL